MFWFSPKKEVKEVEEEDNDYGQMDRPQKKETKDSYLSKSSSCVELPVSRRSVESKSLLSYLGFGSNSHQKEIQDESDDECEIDDVDEDSDIKKVFHQPLSLPPNFADEVLDLEMKIESSSDFTQKDVDRLVYLYSQAMEFYEESNKDKYNSLKDRIQKLLVNPIVFNRMKNQEVKTRERCLTDINRPNALIKVANKATRCKQGPLKPIHEKPIFLGSKKAKEKQLEMSMMVLGAPIEEEKTKIMDKYIQNLNHVEKNKSNIVHSDISSQTMNLQKRLAQRKFTISSNNRSSNKTQGNSIFALKTKGKKSSDSNDSGGFCNTANIADLERLNEG